MKREPVKHLEPTTVAEALIELGKSMKHEIKNGETLDQISSRLESTPRSCRLAMQFIEMDVSVIFRALAEDWSIDEIVAAVHRRACQAA